MAREVTLRDPRDTYVNQVAPSRNYADKSALIVNGDNAGNAQRRVFLFFAPLPRDAFAVLSATLTFTLKGDWPSGSHVVTAKRITHTWKENEVTWENQPNISDTHSATVTVTGGTGTGGDQYDIDVASMLQDVADGDNWYGIRLAVDTNGNKNIHSSKADLSRFRPHIDVSFAVQPDAPDTLHPDNERGVVEAKPLLQWDFDDATEDSTQGYSNIQIDNNISFASPVYDTGWQSNTLQHWDTNDDVGMSNLTNGVQYYWRVRIKNNHGIISPWSEVATFWRFTLGTLTIDQPATDDQDVDDNETTINWTLSSRTQAFMEQTLFRKDAHRDVRLHTWSKRASTATHWDIPYGFVDTLGQHYGIHVRTWDDKNRSNKDYLETVRTFYFNPSGVSYAAPTNFDATVLGPYIELTWHRSSDPDFWGIFADNVLIAQPEGNDRYVSGTLYNYLYHGGFHGHPIDFQVRAKKDGVGFSDNAGVVTKSPSRQGIWLIETEVGIGVQLLGTAELGSVLSEDSQVFKLLNRRQPVKITSALHGYEGQAQGTLAQTGDGQDPKDERDIIEDIFANYSTSSDLRLIGGTRNIKVNVSNLTLSEWPTAGETVYDVSFEWVQVDGFPEVDK